MATDSSFCTAEKSMISSRSTFGEPQVSKKRVSAWIGTKGVARLWHSRSISSDAY